MQVKWLIEKDVFNENFDRLSNEIVAQGHSFSVIDYMRFLAGKDDPCCDEDDCVIFYGSLESMSYLQRNKKWVPGGWCNLPNFRCSKYYAYFGEHLLNKNYMILPIGEIVRRHKFIENMYGIAFPTKAFPFLLCHIHIEGKIFIRPDSGFKEFAGQVIRAYPFNLKEDLGYGEFFNDPSLLVIISSPKKIEREWRLVVCEKKVIAGSQYKIDGELEVEKNCPKEVIDFGNKVASNKWEPDPIYVMDIGQCNGEVSLIELNAFSTSGLYDCDCAIIVKEANKLAIKEWQEQNEE